MSSEFRLRVQFEKREKGAWLSHLEVLHTVDRIVRRARLPYAITQGFNPHMKLAFGPALGVGTGSTGEYFDVWLTEYIKPDNVLAALQQASTAVLPIVAVGYVGAKEPSLAASLTIMEFRARVYALDIEVSELEAEFRRLQQQEVIEIEQKNKIKFFDPATCIPKDVIVSQEDGVTEITLTLRVSQAGSLRPDSLLNLALANCNAHYSHFMMVRTSLFSETDEGQWVRPL